MPDVVNFLKKLMPHTLKQTIMREFLSQLVKERPYLALVQRIDALEKALQEVHFVLHGEVKGQRDPSPMFTNVEDLQIAFEQLQSILQEEKFIPSPASEAPSSESDRRIYPRLH